MEKWLRYLIILLMLFISSFIIILSNLNQSEEPKKSDIIVVLQGSSNFERERVAVNLLNQGYSASGKIIVSPLTNTDKQAYLESGVNQEQIINEPNATTTYTNAIYTLKLMDELDIHSAIILTSDYHTLRTKMIFNRIKKEHTYDIELTFVGANHRLLDKNGSTIDIVPWYRASWSVKKNALIEYFKYIGYFFELYKFS